MSNESIWHRHRRRLRRVPSAPLSRHIITKSADTIFYISAEIVNIYLCAYCSLCATAFYLCRRVDTRTHTHTRIETECVALSLRVGGLFSLFPLQFGRIHAHNPHTTTARKRNTRTRTFYYFYAAAAMMVVGLACSVRAFRANVII